MTADAASPARANVASTYAPHGALRAAVNFGNPLLARHGASGPAGITVDLAAELARSIGVEVAFVEFDRAFDVTRSAGDDVWDVCFLAADPERARVIAFTAPYVRIGGCYLVRSDAVERSDEVVEHGLRIGVVEGSAYALFLLRHSGAEHLVVYPTFARARAALDAGQVDGLAGIERVMVGEAVRRPDCRVIYPPFMEICQAAGLPMARAGLLTDLQARLARLDAAGRLADILELHGLSGQDALADAGMEGA